MKFSSIKEYFYKLNNLCYVITLIPLGVFIFLYLKMQEGEISAIIQEQQQIMIIQIVVFVLSTTILTIVHLVAKRKMKVHSRELSLGNKMNRYFYLGLNRIVVGALVSVLVAGGLLITASEIFSAYFLGILLWMAYQWPTPKKMCAELLLKGDEKEMVLYKRESL
ncbi:MAG: hypothetical protein KDC93_11380 [Cyclobacteriaceae bacterium]|jgi:hypothetical protein|nr:hypothetical protein [Cyclobacteriaceae bacterium]